MTNIAKVTNEDVLRVIREFKLLYEFDFSNYAEQSFARRIEHLLVSYNLPDVDALINKVKSDKNVFQKCVNDITVNTTELFRDPDIWLSLRRNVLHLFKNNETVNIWHAGCSSGEEVYSMLILLNELDMLEKVKLFATDINTEILERAKKGIFNSRLHQSYFHSFDRVIRINPLNFEEFKDVPYEKYFDLDNISGSFAVKQFIKDKATFKYHNLVDANIFYKFDIIFCRNVIIYFNTELQNRVISTFCDSLFNKGIVFLGIHENISYLPVGSRFENKIMKGLYFKK
jgi:chemotaxis protein methyltransferase CheR